jgi:hypothetical protein
MLWMNPIMDMQKTMSDANDQRAVLTGGWLQTLQAMTVAMYTWAAFAVALTLATIVNIFTVIF